MGYQISKRITILFISIILVLSSFLPSVGIVEAAEKESTSQNQISEYTKINLANKMLDLIKDFENGNSQNEAVGTEDKTKGKERKNGQAGLEIAGKLKEYINSDENLRFNRVSNIELLRLIQQFLPEIIEDDHKKEWTIIALALNTIAIEDLDVMASVDDEKPEIRKSFLSKQTIFNKNAVNHFNSQRYENAIAEVEKSFSAFFDALKFIDFEYKLTVDSDQDGLVNILEYIYKTNPIKADTDGDGLKDSFEISGKLNPGKSDSDADGTSDAEEDLDNDGLVNLQEQEHKTDPSIVDTDGEGLTDSEEVHDYHTSPISPDTDGDGLDDHSEIKFGMDPLNKDTDQNGTLDGKEKRQQELSSPALNVKLSFAATGDVAKTTTILPNEDVKTVVGTNGMIGSPIDITSSSEFDSAILSFGYESTQLGDSKPEDLRVFYFNPETQSLELVENQHVDPDNSQVVAELPHFSTYILADYTIWAKTWKSNLKKGDPLSDSGEQKPLDLVFVIDSSGSMGPGPDDRFNKDIYNYRISGTKLVIDSLTETDRAAIVDFDDYATLRKGLTYGNDAGKVSLKNAANNIDSYGGTNIASGLGRAVSILKTGGRSESNQFIILLTDGENNYSYQDAQTKSYATEAQNLGIKVFTMGLGDSFNADLLKQVAETTGGDFYHVTNAKDLEGKFLQTGTEIGLKKDSDEDGLPDWVEEKGFIIKGTLDQKYTKTDINLPDTDGDGLSDAEELGDWYYEVETGTVYVSRETGIPNISDPTQADSDNDGLTDYEEVGLETRMFLPDTDGDGLKDGDEADAEYDPLHRNPDGDTYSDLEEMENGTDPFYYDKKWYDHSNDILSGAVFGDGGQSLVDNGLMDENTYNSFGYLTGQIVSGIIVIGDIRDVLVNLGQESYGGALLSAFGFIPAIGDAGKIIGEVTSFARRGPKNMEIAIKFVNEELREADPALADEVLDALKSINGGKVLKFVPSVKDGQFNRWFNELTPDDFDEIWADPKLRRSVENRLRHPGGLHEWHLVSRTSTFKRWGVSAEQIKDLRTIIEDVKFVNPEGTHGGKGSTKAHNELLELIDSSTDYEMFKRRLQNWAAYRLEGGVDALPDGLRP